MNYLFVFQMGKPKKDKASYPLTRHRTLAFHICGNVLCSYKRNIDKRAENMSPLKLLRYLSLLYQVACVLWKVKCYGAWRLSDALDG